MRSPKTLFACIALLVALPWAHAEDRVWVGRSPFNDNWSEIFNWDPLGEPLDDDSLIFRPGPIRTTPYADHDFTIFDLTFDDDFFFAPPAYTINGSGTLTISNGILNASRTAQRVNAPIRIASGHQVAFSNPVFDDGRLTIGGTVDNRGQLLVDAGSAGIHIDGVISGSNSLVKVGPGILDLTQANTYTGRTELNEGAILLSGAGRLSNSTNVLMALAGGSPLLELDGIFDAINDLFGQGTIRLTRGATLEVGNRGGFAGGIEGNGNLNKTGAGILELFGNNKYTGHTLIDGGTLRLSGSGRLSDATDVTISAGAHFELAAVNDTINSLSDGRFGGGAVHLTTSNAMLIIGSNPGSGGAGSFSGTIDGAGTLVKRGTGTLSLSGANSYSGDTLIEGGALTVTRSAISPSSSVMVSSGLYTMTGSPGVYAPASLSVGALGTALLTPGSDKLLRTRNVAPVSTGKFDLTDNVLVLDGASLAVINFQIARARNGGPTGLWSGAGITSSAAAASPAHSLGVILNNNGSGQPLYTSFHGATGLTASTILVAYTLTGDLNLDGAVSISDFLDLASHFGQSNATWGWGDVNYDRSVSIADFIDLASNFGATYSGAAAVDAHILTVPEPAIIAIVALTLVCASMRRPTRIQPRRRENS